MYLMGTRKERKGLGIKDKKNQMAKNTKFKVKE